MKKFLSIFILTLLFSCAETSKTDSLDLIALDFINEYTALCNDQNNESSLIEWVNKNPYVTEEFSSSHESILKAARERDSIFGLGFDPIFNAQDYPDKGFYVSNKDSTSGTVLLKGIDWEEYELNVLLIKVNRVWKINQVGAVNVDKPPH